MGEIGTIYFSDELPGESKSKVNKISDYPPYSSSPKFI